jgi:RAQPRD family integrative conjugative element protein
MKVALYMKFIIICFVSVFSSQALAVTSEREELANYLRELNKIDRIFLAAKSNSQKNSVNRFKYEVFEKDLNELKRELQIYLDLPNRNPRFLNGTSLDKSFE